MSKPKTVEMKLIIPYAALIIIITSLISLYAGWTIHKTYTERVQVHAAALIEDN